MKKDTRVTISLTEPQFDFLELMATSTQQRKSKIVGDIVKQAIDVIRFTLEEKGEELTNEVVSRRLIRYSLGEVLKTLDELDKPNW